MDNLRFYITIDCANDAFADGIDMEVARILRQLADRLDNEGDDEYTLMDYNGNKVGRAVYDSVDRETSTVR